MAHAATSTLSSFPRFMNLALELRNQIWSNPLPEKIDSALYLIYNLRFEFHHDLLDQIQVYTPLVFFNHEARETAVAWAHKQGVFINENKGYPVFGRPFNPESDILYVRPDDIYNFWTETSSIHNPYSGLIGKYYAIRSFVEKIAISEDTWREELKSEPENQSMHELTYHFPLKMLIIITDTPSELQSANCNLEMRQHWELDSTRGGEYVLDADDGTSQFHGSKHTDKEELYKSLENGSKRLLEVDHQVIRKNFKVQPAFVSKR